MPSQWSDPVIILTASSAFIALIYTLVTVFIWHATWQNTRATRDVLESAHRPYVGVMKMEFGSEGIIGETWLFARISNVGTVPSRRVEVELEITIAGIISTRKKTEANRITLLPGQSTLCKKMLSEEDKERLIRSNSGLQVKVAVLYNGMTDRQYATHSTYVCNGLGEPFELSAGHLE